MNDQDRNHEAERSRPAASHRQNLMSPLAIVASGILIAGAIVYSSGKNAPTTAGDTEAAAERDLVGEDGTSLDRMAPVSETDHIRGNPNAPIKIVEYSDTECPFCKKFHLTMKQVTEKYAEDGKVAWVYRHFPIDQLHQKARKEAEATECAAELGGNDAFWAYLDRLMEVTPANDGLDPAELPKIAKYVGLDTGKFDECFASGKYAEKIEGHVQDAVATGGNGTPWSIVMGADGKKYPLSGAQTATAIERLIGLASEEK